MHNPTQPLRICATANLWSSLLIIAQAQDLFADAGLDVRITFDEAAKVAMGRLLSGEVHMATVVPIDLATMSAQQAVDYPVVATICVAANNAIVASRSTGIRLGGDLKGKRLGVLAGTSSMAFAERVIRQHGLEGRDVRLTPLDRPEIETALLAGKVDAVSVWQPLTSRIAEGLGENNATVILDPDYLGFMNLCVSGDWCGTNGDALTALLRVLQDAERFTRRHPASAQKIVAAQIGMDLETVASLWDSYDLHLHLDTARLERAIAEEGIAISAGLARSAVAFDARPLEMIGQS